MPPEDPKLNTAPDGKSEVGPKFGVTTDVVAMVASSGSNGRFASSSCMCSVRLNGSGSIRGLEGTDRNPRR